MNPPPGWPPVAAERGGGVNPSAAQETNPVGIPSRRSIMQSQVYAIRTPMLDRPA